MPERDAHAPTGPCGAGHGHTVAVDRTLCVGFAECVKVAPTVFRLDEENVAVVLDPESVDAETLRTAAEACPVDAITLYDPAGRPLWPPSAVAADAGAPDPPAAERENRNS